MEHGDSSAGGGIDLPIQVLNGLTVLPHPDNHPSKSKLSEVTDIDMNLRKTKIFKIIENGTCPEILKVCREYLRAGKNPNMRDPDTGGNILHHMVANSSKFDNPEMVSLVYMLAFVNVEVDAQDFNGDTPLHCVVRQPGAYKLMVALIRCGADTSITNSIGITMEDVLYQEKPPGHEEMAHWYHKFRPGKNKNNADVCIKKAVQTAFAYKARYAAKALSTVLLVQREERLWCLLSQEKPEKGLVEKLLQSWCRLTTVKNGEVINMKSLLQRDIQKAELLQMAEGYESTVELALALIGGLGFLVKKWLKDGTLHDADINTKDASYQIRYPDYPECPQPLLAATWEANIFEAVDVLMELGPDTNVLCASQPDLIPKPFIFQIINNAFRPRETKIIHRVLEKADMSVRNHLGHTLLFQAILNEEPLETINLLLRRHVNVGARDKFGRTARDLATELDYPKVVKAIDSYVIQLVRDRDFPRVERLLLDGYDHLWNIKDATGRPSIEIAKRFSSPQVYELVRMGEPVQLYIKRVFRSVDDGNVDELQKLLSCRKYASGLDQCGRTPLMKAILLRRRGLAMKLLTECSFTVNAQDSLGRSTLHYAYLFLDDPDLVQLIERNGANPHLEDWQGRHPKSYSQSELNVQGFCQLKREALDADLDIYTFRTDFEKSFRTAIKNGDLHAVKELVWGLAQNGDIARYSYFLFECVDLCREDIAIYLLESGFRHDIFRSYVKRDPCVTPCAMGECNHSVISLRQRALSTGSCRVVKLINRMTDGRKNATNSLKREAAMLLNYGMH